MCQNRTVVREPIADQAALGQRIAAARADADLTQGELASAVGLDRTAVAKIEAGTRKVSATELVGFAAALDRPIDWFVLESPAAVVSRRSDPAVGGRSRALDVRVERLARDVEFLSAERILPDPSRPTLSVPRDLTEAEAHARTARERMGVQGGPLHDLQRHCEEVGLLAFALDLDERGGDAAYVAVGDWGVALLNGAVDPGRRRFNLAHELGHHLFEDAYAPEISLSPTDETERLINAFAVHLLMPRDAVEEVWREHLDAGPRLAAVAVAVRFRASWSAVCSQLRNLGVIDAAERETLAGQPPTRADFVELGESWVAELEPPSIPPGYGRRVLGAYRAGKLTAARSVELLWGTVSEEDLPPHEPVPLDALRREFEPLP